MNLKGLDCVILLLVLSAFWPSRKTFIIVVNGGKPSGKPLRVCGNGSKSMVLAIARPLNSDSCLFEKNGQSNLGAIGLEIMFKL